MWTPVGGQCLTVNGSQRFYISSSVSLIADLEIRVGWSVLRHVHFKIDKSVEGKIGRWHYLNIWLLNNSYREKTSQPNTRPSSPTHTQLKCISVYAYFAYTPIYTPTCTHISICIYTYPFIIPSIHLTHYIYTHTGRKILLSPIVCKNAV